MSSSAPVRGAGAFAPQITESGCEAGAWARLAPILRRLDGLLAQAVETAQLRFGEEAAADPYRGLHITPDQVERALAIAPGTPLLFRAVPPDGTSEPAETSSLTLFHDVLGLEDFDLDVLVIALAPELDLRYERLYAYLQDDVTRRRPTVDLALNLLCRSAADRLERRRHFLPQAPLLRHGLIELVADPAQAAPPLLAHYVRLDGQVLRRLLGQDGLDASLSPFCELVLPCASPAAPHVDPATASALTGLTAPARAARRPLILHFHGPAGTGRRRAAEALAGRSWRRCSRSMSGRHSRERSPGAAPSLSFSGRLGLTALCSISTASMRSTARSRHRERRVLLRAAAEGGVVVIVAGARTPGRDMAGAVAISFEVARSRAGARSGARR